MFLQAPPSSSPTTISLALFMNLPFDILASIFMAFNSPRDLLAMTRSHKSFRFILTQECTQFIWRHVRENFAFPQYRSRLSHPSHSKEAGGSDGLVHMPQKPEWMREPMFAELAFGTGICEICHRSTELPLLDHGLYLQLCGRAACLDEFKREKLIPLVLRDGGFYPEHAPMLFPLISVASSLDTFYPDSPGPYENEEYPQALFFGSEAILSACRRVDFEQASGLQKIVKSGWAPEAFDIYVMGLSAKQRELRDFVKKISNWSSLYTQHQRYLSYNRAISMMSF